MPILTLLSFKQNLAEGLKYTNFSIFATVKIGFYHNFISLWRQNYTFDPFEFFCGIRYMSCYS